jgi:hypothetical protein
MSSEDTRPRQAVPDLPTQPFQNEVTATRKRPISKAVVIGCLGLSILAIIILAIAVPATAYIYYQIGERIVPGVRVGGLELSGLTRVEAKKGLDRVYPQELEIFITDGTRTWTGRASDFGIGWDTDTMIQQALNVAHGKSLSSELSEMLESIQHGWEVEPVTYFNVETARIELLKWEATVNVLAKNADLRIVDGQVETLPPENGLSLDVETTLDLLSENPEAVIDTGELWLFVRSQEPEIADVSSVRDRAEEILSANVTVQAYDPVEDELYAWQAGREEIGTWLGVQKTDLGYELFLQESEIENFANELIASLSDDQYLEFEDVVASIQNAIDGSVGDPLRVYHRETTYIVQPGDTLLEIGWQLGFPFWMIMDANPYLYSNPLEYGQELVIPSRDALMPLPVIPDKRIVISITDQRLRAYQNGELLWGFIASTGIDDSPTQPGVFQVRTHELNAYASEWDLYMPHFLGVYEAWPEFMNGIHGLPMLSSGRRLWANVLGRPASYGCIILTLEDAETLYNWAEDGVVVEILR